MRKILLASALLFAIPAWAGSNSGAPQGCVSINVQKFTSPGTSTYTASGGLVYAKVTCLGGGGGGGGTVGSATADRLGGGGASGGYSIYFGTATAIGASQTVVVGAAGLAGASGTNSGGSGGNSTFGSTLCVGTGGAGGTYNDQSGSYGASGGATAAGTGTETFIGQAGQTAMGAYFSLGSSPFPNSVGGSNPFGQGGLGTGGAGNGTAGTGYGAGGSGGNSAGSATNYAGSAGLGGLVIVEECLNH